VHLPLSAEAQAEARILMLSAHNVLSPAHGRPITIPTQDMVLGLYYLTVEKQGANGEGRSFSSPAEAIMALEFREVDLQAKISVRLAGKNVGMLAAANEGETNGTAPRIETTIGRILFNEALPADYPYVNQIVQKKQLTEIVDECADIYDKSTLAHVLDEFKALGFHWATRAGVTIGVEDVMTPPEKPEILEKFEKKADKVEDQYRKGIITDEERRQELIEIWTQATDDVRIAMERHFTPLNPIYMMANSGARGNLMQIRQIAAMRGLVANPKGDIIPRPIKANFREGLSVLEYFISTHGARKGLADTALRTADSGYLTRRLVDVAQDVIIREPDCGTDKGVPVQVMVVERDGGRVPSGHLNTKLFGRVLAEDVWSKTDGSRKKVMKANDEITDAEKDTLVDAEVDQVMVRSVLTCDSRYGVCAACYGRNLATGRMVEVGEAVGIIAAQSIGEPGTQLTMRTFHTGGVAGEDITHGLPRVVELFEARKPKGEAQISELSGTVEIIEGDKAREIKVTSEDGKEEIAYKVPRRARLRVQSGDAIRVGQQVTEGSANPHEILRIEGPQKVQLFLVGEVQQVYQSQGVVIHDKHIELIVRQMLKRVNVLEPGNTDFLPGQLVERRGFEDVNRKVVEDGGDPASARPMLMGITKASLATDSWLSAASFQETTRVLTDAAISGKSDPLLGLKENVIIGKLIPAGTGMARYRTIKVFPTEVPERLYALPQEEEEFGPTLETGPRTFQMPVPPQFAEPTGDGEQPAPPAETGTEEG
jgi:DNA-directed RNA polymerase subunit beta'